MKSRALLLLGGMLLWSSSLIGAPCAATQSIASLIGLGATGCDINYLDFTITFSNFNATGSALTGQADRDMNIAVGGNPLVGLGGFTFTNPTVGNFPTAFTLGYTATINGCAATFTCALTGYAEQTFIVPNTSGAVVMVMESAGPSPVTLNVGNQTSTQFPAFSVPSVIKMASYNGVTTLISFESDVFGTATTAIPEPLGLSMVGFGLVALGVWRRQRSVRDH
jgi:hypothetical protein